MVYRTTNKYRFFDKVSYTSAVNSLKEEKKKEEVFPFSLSNDCNDSERTILKRFYYLEKTERDQPWTIEKLKKVQLGVEKMSIIM